jgi:hypothetical protein
LSAILSQVQQGKERLIAVASRKTTAYECNYPSYKGELCALVMGLRKFKHILLFKPFLVFTDSSALKHLATLKEPTGIMARWLEEVQNYRMEVHHKPGKLNRNADALSRATHLAPPSAQEIQEEAEYVAEVGPAAADSLDRINLRAAQQKDPVLSLVRTWIKKGAPGSEEMRGLPLEAQKYKQVIPVIKLTEDGLLLFPYKLNGPADRVVERILVPEEKKEDVFYHVHQHPTAGHFGSSATAARARPRFYWPGMEADLRKAVATCGDCLAKQQGSNLKRGTLQPRRAGYPFQRLYVDLVGPLSISSKNNKYLLTIEDSFTRYAAVLPIPNKEAVTVARSLVDRFICVYGCPVTIHSDQGKEFTAEVFRETMKTLGIQQTQTPPYNPQSNPVERFHRTLNAMMRVHMSR